MVDLIWKVWLLMRGTDLAQHGGRFDEANFVVWGGCHSEVLFWHEDGSSDGIIFLIDLSVRVDCMVGVV